MEVLGRVLVAPFDGFWEQYGQEAETPLELIQEGDPTVFGPDGYQKGSQELPPWMELPDEALSYHVAHELTHQVMRTRGFPLSVRGQQYGGGSPEAEVGRDLEEMVSHPALEELLRPFGFNGTHILLHLFESARQGLESSPIPETGTPMWATWACRFCELQFLLPERQWLRLEVVYDGRCPDIADKGRELADIMRAEGFSTPDQALHAMIRARDALGLKEAMRSLVLDPREGKVY